MSFRSLFSKRLVRVGNPEGADEVLSQAWKGTGVVCIISRSFKDWRFWKKIFRTLYAGSSTHVSYYRCLLLSLPGRKAQLPRLMPISVKIPRHLPDFSRLLKFPVFLVGGHPEYKVHTLIIAQLQEIMWTMPLKSCQGLNRLPCTIGNKVIFRCLQQTLIIMALVTAIFLFVHHKLRTTS